jgi:hypothetical protein
MNGLARWLAVVLALFGMAAAMLLSIALSLGSARGKATADARSTSLDAEPRAPAPQVLTGTSGSPAARREPARR